MSPESEPDFLSTLSGFVADLTNGNETEGIVEFVNAYLKFCTEEGAPLSQIGLLIGDDGSEKVAEFIQAVSDMGIPSATCVWGEGNPLQFYTRTEIPYIAEIHVTTEPNQGIGIFRAFRRGKDQIAQALEGNDVKLVIGLGTAVEEEMGKLLQMLSGWQLQEGAGIDKIKELLDERRISHSRVLLEIMRGLAFNPVEDGELLIHKVLKDQQIPPMGVAVFNVNTSTEP